MGSASGWIALVSLVVTSVALLVGVAFRAGRVWEGMREYQDRLKALEGRHRELHRQVYNLRVDAWRTAEDVQDGTGEEGSEALDRTKEG